MCRIVGVHYFLAGSSPRLWGTYYKDNPWFPEVRFIPTPVGNISTFRPHAKLSAVHPHACGEHSCPSTIQYFIFGSSPRLWGTFSSIPSINTDIRFIPTPVGNILTAKRLASSISVHPHACGEHRDKLPRRYRNSGSSPRLWGTW